MMSMLSILAKSEDDSIIKLIFGVIVVAFWLISALVSAINKKAKETRRRESFGQLPRDLKSSPPLPPEVRLKRMTAPPPKIRPAQKSTPRSTYAAPAIVAMPTSNLSRAATATQVTRTQSAAKVVPPGQIARLLQRPDTLRAAFVLNEVLTPPLSIRGEPGGRGHV
jgi:hypothetical protein